MKIMQINVWQGRLIRPLLALIRTENPDLILAQEIYSYPHPMASASPWNYLAMVEFIAANGQYPHVYFSPSSTFTIFGQGLSYGNAVFSKYPIHHRSTHYTGGPGPIHYHEPGTFDGNDSRNFQHVIINTGRTELNVINHHAHWVNQPLGDEISVERLRKLASYIGELEGPIITGGDFNLLPHSPAMAEFIKSTGLISAATGASSTLSAAHYMSDDIVCDYVLTSPGLKVGRVDVVDKLVSDHKAIIVEIDC